MLSRYLWIFLVVFNSLVAVSLKLIGDNNLIGRNEMLNNTVGVATDACPTLITFFWAHSQFVRDLVVKIDVSTR